MIRCHSKDEIEKACCLAAYTDALLESRKGQSPAMPRCADLTQEEARLIRTVEALAQALDAQPPPERLRRQVRQRILVEWGRRQATKRRWLAVLFQRPAQRWAWATVAALLVIVAAIALTSKATSAITGTIIGGGIGTLILVALLGLAVVLLIVWIILRRR